MADENNNNDENQPQPKPFPPEMTDNAESKTVGHLVRDYLWGKGPIDYQNVSAHLNRDLLVRFVEFELRDLPPYLYWRVRILADLYNLKEFLDFFESWLNKQEAEPNDLDRSIACTIILKEIGDSARQKFAVNYYNYLVSHRFANQKFEELVKCLAALGNDAEPNPLLTRMQVEIKTLETREAAGDAEAGVEKRVIEEIVDNDFFFIGEANKSKRRLSTIADKNKRLLELIRVYLELTDEDGGAEYLNLWIQQQIRRTAESEGNETVIEAFGFTVKSFGELPSAAEEIFCKLRCYNAVEFFFGKLDAQEGVFMKKYERRQVDPLRYMPPALHIDVEEIEEDDEAEIEDEEKEKTEE